jgi:transposase-like protein
MMKGFTDGLTPNASGVWHVDEMMVKVKRTRPMKVGNPAKEEHYAWLWNLMDRETRFLLASQIHKKREITDARGVFAEGKAITRTTPLAVIHDGLTAYDDAFNKEFYRNCKPRVTNIRSIGAAKHGRNQHIERMNGTIRDREKSMRGMGTDASAQTLMDGQRLVYNYIRPHMALGGQTPAEAAGIDLGLKGNRVEMLIEKSYAARNTERTGGSNLG